MPGVLGFKSVFTQYTQQKRQAGVSADCRDVSNTLASYGRSVSRLPASLQHHAFSRSATSNPAALHPDVLTAGQDTPIRHHLETLYEANSFLVGCPRQASQCLNFTFMPEQQAAGVQMAVMEKEKAKNESPSTELAAADAKRRQQNYYANVGDAIRTLRDEVPLLFVAPLSYDIYRDDVVFKDPRNIVRGKKNYQRIFRGVRALGRIAFLRTRLDVQRIWQPDPKCISLRWQFHGVPRIPWEVEGIFDGVSQFKLDSDGKIYEHSVTNVILRKPPLGISPLWNTLARLFAREPQPYPGINFQNPADAVQMVTSLAAPEDADIILVPRWSREFLNSLLSPMVSYATLGQQDLSLE